MSIAIGQHAVNELLASAASATTVGVATQASGSTFVVFAVSNGGFGATPITDSNGNTWVHIQSDVAALSVTGTLWYCANATGGASHTFTATSTSTGVTTIWMVELTGAAAASFDQSAAGNDDTVSPFTSGTTGTTAQANEMALAFKFDNRGANAPAWTGYTTIDDAADTGGITGTSANKLLSAIGTQQSSFTLTTATDCVSFIATFKEAASTTISVPMMGRCTYTLP